MHCWTTDGLKVDWFREGDLIESSVSVSGQKEGYLDRGWVNRSVETLRLSYCNGQSTNGTKEILSPDFLVIKTKKFFSCNQNKGAWQLTLLLCSERMQKQVRTKKVSSTFSIWAASWSNNTNKTLKKIQAFGVWKVWRLAWSFDDPIWRADRSWWEAGQSTRPRCMGGVYNTYYTPILTTFWTTFLLLHKS